MSLHAFASRTNLELCNYLTFKLVKKFIINLDSLKAPGLDCVPLVVLKTCEPGLLFILGELFNKCLEESSLQDWWKVSSVVPVCWWEVYCEKLLSCFLSVVSKVFDKLVNDRLVDHLEKCGFYFYFQYGFRFSCSSTGLLAVLELQHLVYRKLLARFCMLVFFTNLSLTECQLRYLALFCLFSVIDSL